MDAFGAAAVFLYTVLLVGSGVHAVRSIARWRRLRNVHVVVATHRHAGEACMVCASRAVRMIAPYVVRCDECGFLGGASVPPLRAVLTRVAALDEAPPMRRAS